MVLRTRPALPPIRFPFLRTALLPGLLVAPLAAAQDAATLASAEAYGNLHAAGVVATVSGDADGDATATLEWRSVGGAFAPAQPLVRVSAARFSGSLFGLVPGTAYEARVTLSDPDGVTGAATAVATFSTRPEVLPEPTLRTLWVAPGGDDGNPGTDPSAPLRTIQRAADLSQPGDLVRIRAGVYREAVTVPRSGTASQPIVFRGEDGAVLDGADGTIAAGVAWSAGAGGTWSLVPGFTTGHVVTDQGRLYRYDSLAALQALGAGAPGGFHFDGTTLYVKNADGSAPSARTMHVARRENGFTLDGVSNVRIEALEIRHHGAGDYGKGVYLRWASDDAVVRCRIHENGSAGVWVKGGDRHRVEDNEIWDTSIPGWPWGFTKGSSAENNAVVLTDDVGRGNVVRRNAIRGVFNGVAPCGSLPPPGGTTNETDVSDNVLSEITDDAFEPEGHCANVRLFRNRVSDVHMAFAVAPAEVGPLWIVRNVAWRFGSTRTSQVDGYLASPLKVNSGYPEPVGPLLLLQNTFLTDAPSTDGLALLNPGASTFVRSRNNVISGTRWAVYKVNPIAWDGDGDDLYTTDPSRFASWTGTSYATFAAFRSGTGQEPAGTSAAPLLAAPAAGDFTPQPGSPLVDAGLLLPGISDGFSGAGPDVGAVERAAPPASSRFHVAAPCRLADTRFAEAPALRAGVARAVPVAGRCGVPYGARAASLNVTVTSPAAAGFLTLFATGSAVPPTSTVNFGAGVTRANNAVVPLGPDGSVTAVYGQVAGTVHLVLDVNGWFE